MDRQEIPFAKQRFGARDRSLLFKFQRHAAREMKQLLDRRDLRFEIFPAGGIVYFHHKQARLPGGTLKQQNRALDVFLPGLRLGGEMQGRCVSRHISG
jgi:hypothetical protein